MENKLYDKFTRMFSELGPQAVLRGDALLVEILEEPEIKTESGLIIAEDPEQVRGGVNNNKAKVGRVIATGEGYYDPETKENIPLDVPVGAVVMHPPYSVVEYSTFPGLAGLTGNKLGIISEKEVAFYYSSLEAYNKAMGLLNNND